MATPKQYLETDFSNTVRLNYKPRLQTQGRCSKAYCGGSLENVLPGMGYHEFSLKVGDKLRESIEKGLKDCRKCILVLSPNFF